MKVRGQLASVVGSLLQREGPRGGTQVLGLGGKHLCLPSHLAGPHRSCFRRQWLHPALGTEVDTCKFKATLGHIAGALIPKRGNPSKNKQKLGLGGGPLERWLRT